MELKRRKFQGVLNILSFNRHFYVFGLAVLLALFASAAIIHWPPVLFDITIAAFAYGLVIPLLVSAYVYDFSGYYELNWTDGLVQSHPDARLIININAGFDETSYILEQKFPRAVLKAFDFYDPKRHTEAAIRRARRVSLVYPDTRHVASQSLPLTNRSVDLVFLLSAIHEIRSHDEKILFLRECHRICKPAGRVVMVEHLRDFPNFLAFTVGFTHFFSRATWKDALTRAGFTAIRETKFTPFMSVFECIP